jgi:hypothetical protein
MKSVVVKIESTHIRYYYVASLSLNFTNGPLRLIIFLEETEKTDRVHSPDELRKLQFGAR